MSRFFTKLRLKIFFSLIISFVLSSFFIRFFFTPQSIPELILSLKPQLLFNNLPSIKLPSFTIFNSSITPFPATSQKPDEKMNFLPNTTQTKNTSPAPSTIQVLSPTTFLPTITIKVSPIISPTVKPTNTPTPTPNVVRPGRSWDEITSITAEKTCVPQALIKAISVEEAGTVSNYKSADFEFFNTFNWWNSSSATKEKICYGWAYNACDNRIPDDSQASGEYCNSGQIGGICLGNPLILGPMQMGESEWSQRKPRVIEALSSLGLKVDSNTIDRRVMLDGFLAGGFFIKDYSYSSSCSGWDAYTVQRVAKRYYGKCEYTLPGRTGNYCRDVCQLYNRYGGSANCSLIQ